MRAGGARKNPFDGIIQDFGKHSQRQSTNSAHRSIKSKRGKKCDEHSQSQERNGKPEIECNQQQPCSLLCKQSGNKSNMNGVVSGALRMELSGGRVDAGVSAIGVYNANLYKVSSKQKGLTANGEPGSAYRNEQFSPGSYSSECGGEGELEKPTGWSTMNTKAERTELTQSDVEEMLQLSQRSVAREELLAGRTLSPVTSDANETPEKRRKKQTGAIQKRPRCGTSPSPLARDILELLQPESVSPEGKYVADSKTKNTKESRGKKIRSHFRTEGQEEYQCVGFHGDDRMNQNSDTSLEQHDLMEQRETLVHKSPVEDFPSSEPLKKVVITVRCKCPSDCKHISSRGKRERQSGVGSPGYGSNTQVPSPEKPRKLDRISGNATCAGDENLREPSLQERRGMKSFMDNSCDIASRDGKRMNMISTMHGIYSPRDLERASEDHMHVTALSQGVVGSQNCSAIGSTSGESSSAEPALPSGEDGYRLSREGIQIGLQVRQTLLGHSDSIQNDPPSPRAESQSLEREDTIGRALSQEGKRFQPSCEDSAEDTRRSSDKAIIIVQPNERGKDTKPILTSAPEVKQSELSRPKAKRLYRRTKKKAGLIRRDEQLLEECATIVQEGSQQNEESDEAANAIHLTSTQTLTEPVSPGNQAQNSTKKRKKKSQLKKQCGQDRAEAGLAARIDDAPRLDGGEESHTQQQETTGAKAESGKFISPERSSSKNVETHSSNYSYHPKTNDMNEKKSAGGGESQSSEPTTVGTEPSTVTREENRSNSESPTVLGKSTISPQQDHITDIEVPIKSDPDGRITDVDNYTVQTEKLKVMKAERTSKGEDLGDLVDLKELNKQSQLLLRRPSRLRNSGTKGKRQKATNKALDEMSDDEDSKNNVWRPALSSSRSQGRTSSAQVERERIHPMTTRRRASQFPEPLHKVGAVIDLTDSGDDAEAAVTSRKAPHDDDITRNLKELQKLSLQDRSKAFSDRPRCKYLTPLSSDESKLATQLITKTKLETRIVTIAEARITLLGGSFKRLRGTRWLDDELLNAYVSLINSRNDAVFHELSAERRSGIPRTYMFNTFFFTRLCPRSSGFDYPGVRGWTKRAKVDILQKDIILVPINLGNHHWVLSMIDMEHQEVLYLDSMHGPDTANALSKLKRWVFEELRNKHGESVAHEYNPESWKEIKQHYRVRRIGVLPASLEAREAKAGRMSKVPKQRDGGSCGVFTAKLADCLSLGIKVYFTQRDIPLIRRRMALDLFHGYLPL